MKHSEKIRKLGKKIHTDLSEARSVIARKCRRRGTRIFVCDDDPNDLPMIEEMLRKLGYRTVSGRTDEDFIKVLRENDIGMLITDALMPMAGEIIEALKEYDIPVLAVTHLNPGDDRLRFYRNMGIHILDKIDMNRLRDEVLHAFGLPVDTREGRASA